MILITDKCNIMIIMTLNLNLKKWRDILGPGPGGLRVLPGTSVQVPVHCRSLLRLASESSTGSVHIN